MSIVVEDGTGKTEANSYVARADWIAYCADRGLTSANTTAGDAALIRATAAIDALYGPRFMGFKVNGRNQALQWPRVAAYDAAGYVINDASVPPEIVHATFEAAVRELASPGSMTPDLERGGALKRFVAGPVEAEWADGAQATTVFSIIDGILAPLLGGTVNQYTAKAVRA